MAMSIRVDAGREDAAVDVAMVGLARGLRNHGVDHAGSVLRFLHLLCEGHNLEMQDFLRFQPGAPRSIDLVFAAADAVVAATPFITPLIVDTVDTALLAIAEFVQSPCRRNQVRVLVDSALCSSCNAILNFTENESGSEGMMRRMMPGSGTQNAEAHLDPALKALQNG
ncbi:RyR and IP3R homology associated-domain-containing protein [Baffinella frigidus]|nr:RyR and IP3R homology associated-domain-containing protein [Cryptophyta sp. CCMP2293]